MNLGATVVSLLLIAFALGRKRTSRPTVALRGRAGAHLPCNVGDMPDSSSVHGARPRYALSFFLGITESVMWILWGERYACVKANFTLRHIGTTFGLTLLGTIIWRGCCPRT